MRSEVRPDPACVAPFQGPPLSLISDPGGGIFLFYGEADLFALSTLMAGGVLHRGQSVLFLDGAHHFNPYPLVRLAGEMGQNAEDFLARLFVSRAFTCHQMGSLVLNQLREGLTQHQPGLVILADPLATFYDENVPELEARNLWMHLITALQQLAPGQTFVVLSPYPKHQTGRRVFFLPHLKSCAKRVFQVGRSETDPVHLSLTEEKPGTRQWQLVFEAEALRFR